MAMLSKSPDALPDYGTFYLNSVKAEFNVIEATQPDKLGEQAYAKAKEIADKPSPTWTDVFTLETLVARLQGEYRLRERLCILREKYKTLVGDAAYASYDRCCALDPQKAPLEQVRSSMEQLLAEFHWNYSSARTREALFNDLQRSLLGPLLLYAAVLVLWGLTAVARGTAIPTYPVVLLAGVTGSFSSIMRRLQKAQAMPVRDPQDQVVRFFEFGLGRSGIFLGLASGAVFATVAYLLFIGGMLQGSIFPAMDTPSTRFTGGLPFIEFARGTDPQTGADFAKLLVWSFLSGFAEQLIPDVLDKFSKRAGGAAPAGEGGGEGTGGRKEAPPAADATQKGAASAPVLKPQAV